MTGGLNEEQTTVYTCILDVSFSLCGEFLTQIRRVLVFDIFDDVVPATLVSYLYFSSKAKPFTICHC